MKLQLKIGGLIFVKRIHSGDDQKRIAAMNNKPRLRDRACNGMITERTFGLLNRRG